MSGRDRPAVCDGGGGNRTRVQTWAGLAARVTRFSSCPACGHPAMAHAGGRCHCGCIGHSWSPTEPARQLPGVSPTGGPKRASVTSDPGGYKAEINYAERVVMLLRFTSDQDQDEWIRMQLFGKVGPPSGFNSSDVEKVLRGRGNRGAYRLLRRLVNI